MLLLNENGNGKFGNPVKEIWKLHKAVMTKMDWIRIGSNIYAEFEF